MVIKGVPLKKIFNPFSVMSYLLKVIVTAICLYIACYTALKYTEERHRELSKMYSDLYTNTNSVKYAKSICLSIDCTYAIMNDRIIRFNHYTGFTDYLLEDKEYNTVKEHIKHIPNNKRISLGDVEYITNQNVHDDILEYIYWPLLAITSIFMFMYHFTHRFLKLYRDDIEKALEKNQLETQLQLELTESLHHEMLPSISLIKTIINDVYMTLVPNAMTKDEIGGLILHKELLPSIITLNQDEVLSLDYAHEQLRLGIARLSSLLNIISNNKYIKYTNDKISIYKIVDSTIYAMDSFKIVRTDIEIEDAKILNSYTIDEPLDNGILMNIVHIMIKNAFEAHATKLRIYGKIEGNKFLLYISDNGSGILDKNGKLLKPNEYDKIFHYGYSTKDRHNRDLCSNWRNILIEQLLKLLDTDKKIKTIRGVGLSLNRKLLRYAGGDIKVVSTSDKPGVHGTTFELTLPAKIIEK